MQIYPANSRYFTEHGPVGKAYFSFSFDEYYDPNNMAFGPMRVLNDDHGVPGGGIGTHPHRDMEIVTLVISGGWLHKDSMGNECAIRAGEIQRMTAGRGILHSEHNISKTEWTNAFQMWFSPNEKGLEPSYEQVKIDFDKMHNQWVPFVKQGGGNNIAHIHQDMGIYLTLLNGNNPTVFKQGRSRRMFLMVIEGSLEIQSPEGPVVLGPRDSARINNETELICKASDPSAQTYAMLIDLP